MWVPTRASKTLTIKSSTARGVGVRNTNVNQTVQAEIMSRISLLPQATHSFINQVSGQPMGRKGFLNEDGLRLGVAPDNAKGLATRTKKPIGLVG